MGCQQSRYIVKVGWAQPGREIPGRTSVGFLGNQSRGEDAEQLCAVCRGEMGGRITDCRGCTPLQLQLHSPQHAAAVAEELVLLLTCSAEQILGTSLPDPARY